MQTEEICPELILLERDQKIYDAVHGFIRFNQLERQLIDSEPFQRLHYLHQLGIAYIVFPGATHTRFEHSLGTMELATRVFEKITSKNFTLETPGYWLQIIRLAALCHDLGHLPFSHDAEKELLPESGHEQWTFKVIHSGSLSPIWEVIRQVYPEKDVAMDVAKMAIGEKKLLEMGTGISFSPIERVLSQVITGDFFGADRIDYLLRDAQCTGVSYGLFDYHQLIEMLRVITLDGALELGIEENGIASCEALLLARHFMHQRVYQYSSVKAYKFHLARFMKTLYSGIQQADLEAYLALSDSEILAALRAASKDPSALGYADASALMHRERRFRAVVLKEGISKEEISKLQVELKIDAGALFFEPAKEKGSSQALSFPVRLRSGAIVSGQSCSEISIAHKAQPWVYIAPEYEAIFRSAIERL